MADDDTPKEESSSSSGKWYKEQIGPLPAGAWIMVIAVAFVYTVWKRKQTATNTPATATADTSTQAGFDPNAIDPNTGIPYAQEVSGGAGGSSGAATSPTSGPTGLQPITDNGTWEREAVTVLIARGYDPVAAQQAMSDFIGGNPLSPQEQAMESLALQLIGPPPSPPPTPPSNTPGTGNNPPPPAAGPPPPTQNNGPPSVSPCSGLPVYAYGDDPNGYYSSIPGYAPPPPGMAARPAIYTTTGRRLDGSIGPVDTVTGEHFLPCPGSS